MTEVTIKHKLENIQHIRAFAVLSVFLFHLGIDGFEWGYIGVDVFFVISGYIMAMITSKRDFEFGPFLMRRIQRLAPALLVMIAVVLFLGLLLQSQSEFYTTSITALSNFVASASFYISSTTGYFDVEAAYRPLIHTWSLSIEWICYLSLALILGLMPARSEKVIIAVFGVSALYVLYNLMFGRGPGYYDVPARMYLFFAGYLFFKHKEAHVFRAINRNAAMVAGAVLFMGVAWLGTRQPWPNYWSLLLPLSVLPFFLVNALNFNRYVNRSTAYVGDISYSLYLWHWVVIWVLTVLSGSDDLRGGSQSIGFVLTVALSVASYHLLERKPFMQKASVIVVMFSVVAGIALFHVATDARAVTFIQTRLSNVISPFLDVEKMLVSGCAYSETVLIERDICISVVGQSDIRTAKDGTLWWVEKTSVPPSGAADNVMIIGDSHSRHFIPMLLTAPHITNVHRLQLSLELQENNFFIDNVLSDPDVYFSKIMDYLEQKGISDIFIAYRFADKTKIETKKIEQFVTNLSAVSKSQGIGIHILRDIPAYQFNPVRCINRKRAFYETLNSSPACEIDLRQPISQDLVKNADRGYWDRFGKRLQGLANVKLIDTHEKLCSVDGCSLYIGHRMVYRDDNHFNERLNATTNADLYARIFGNQPPEQ